MVDIKQDPRIGQIYDDFYNGMFLLKSQESMVDAFKIAGAFPKIVTDTKQVTVYEEEDITKYLKKMPKGKKMAKGASARKFRGDVKTPEGFKLETHQIEYTINNEDMLHPSFNMANEVSAMSLILASDVDRAVFDCVRENAKLVDDPKFVGKWASADMDSMLNDIIRIKKQLRDKNITALDSFAYGDEAMTDLAIKSQIVSEKYQFPHTGFYVDDTIQISSSNHFWGGAEMDDGELLAFKNDIPPLDIIYKKYDNPAIKTVPTIPGLEYVTPVVQMLMYDNHEEQFNPQTTLKMAVTVGAYPRAKGTNMVRVANIL